MTDSAQEPATEAALRGKTIAFLVANEGVEQVELTEPWEAVRRAGGPCLGHPDDVGGFDRTIRFNSWSEARTSVHGGPSAASTRSSARRGAGR